MLAGSEVRCSDRACSVGGVCLSGTTPADGISVNSSPDIRLLPVPAADASGVVQVPRGWQYVFCEPGVAGTVQEPCEPGVLLHLASSLEWVTAGESPEPDPRTDRNGSYSPTRHIVVDT